MKRNDFLARLAKINVWKGGDKRAPHKPLLMLLAFGRMQRGDDRLISYREIDTQLKRLLERFGAPGKTTHPEYPFKWLSNDGLWEIPGVDTLAKTKSGDLYKSELNRENIKGGLLESDYRMLLANENLLNEAAELLLHGHFPPSLHGEIRNAIGLGEEWVLRDYPGQTRDPNFRHVVLRAYEHRCAVCNYDIRVGNELLGLEAAHIKWHAYGGPDEVENGLALCGFHHKAFDRGAWGLKPDKHGYMIQISSEVHGQSDALRWLRDHHGRTLRFPVTSQSTPKSLYVAWHNREVFREPAL